MRTAIKTRIVKIGNSQGVRIPKLLLEQTGIHAEVEIDIEGDHITIRKVVHPRTGWEQFFAEMAQNHDDVLLDEISTTVWDQVEWEW